MRFTRRVYKRALNRAYLLSQGDVHTEEWRKRLATYRAIVRRGIDEGYW